MTQLEMLKKITGETDEDLLEILLERSKNAILSRRYPYGDWPVDDEGETTLESRYSDLQVRIAEALYDKLGGDYETSHSENGISRQWGSEGIPDALLQEITPVCGVLS